MLQALTQGIFLNKIVFDQIWTFSFQQESRTDFISLFIHTPVPSKFVESVLCARHFAQPWEHKMNKEVGYASKELKVSLAQKNAFCFMT